ncbi:MAG TPA: LysR family transcriptional regulator [Alphaproteobacteria bacterium]|jgi:DNA-binding transcriptional LysR family regulator|nr:LysR family transcriptional regulator [Alphaproteobacteria bacterium]
MEYLSDIKIFLKVVQKKSFSAAASELNLSQSAVSKHVARLEQSLGVQLLRRSTHQLSLTEAGADFCERAARIVTELDDARKSAAALSAGVAGALRIHSTFGIGHGFVAPAIARFMELYRDLTIQLIVAPGDTVNVIDQDIDVTVRLHTERDPLRNQTSLSHEVLGSMRYVICGAPDYFARQGEPRSPRELDRHNCLVHSLQPGANHWRFAGPGESEYVVRVSGTYSSNSGAALYDAVKRGIGIARILEPSAREMITKGEVVALFEAETRSTYFVTAYFPRATKIPPKTRAFLDFLRLQLTPAGDADSRQE